MMPFSYKIVGTSHVAKESKKIIQDAIEEFKPDIVCVELDRQRLAGLMSGSDKKSKVPMKMIFQVGLWGYLFSVIGSYIQKKLGSKLGILPGEDMKSAVIIAGQNNIPIALIDQPIDITLRAVSKEFGWRDKWNFVKDFFKGIFMPKRAMKEAGFDNMDLNKVPSEEIVKKAIGLMERRYPGLYKAIVGDRNIYMSKRMYEFLKKDPEKKVLAVVGAGHKEGMEDILSKKLLKLEYVG